MLQKNLQKKQKQRQKREIMDKNQKILHENAYYQKQENLLLKTICHKISLYSIGRNG